MFSRIKLIFIQLLIAGFLLAQNDTLETCPDSLKITFNGQATGWAVGQVESPFGIQFGGRFVPALLGDYKVDSLSKFDFEASLNINGSLNFSGLRYDAILGQIKPYRVWVRYARGPWEVRLGLQKINFGSAKMFRPLMWFDAMDVRDPLQLTDGVYGALGRYYFPNNANIWLWTLVGNKNPKGYERWGSDPWRPEMGARFQTPAGPGEMALSTHYRKVKVQDLISGAGNDYYSLNESRVGLDGKWDVGIGLWFESTLTITDTKNVNLPYLFKYQDMWNAGADYTFGIGNGLGATVEYFRYHAGNQFLAKGVAVDLMGCMLTYPVSLLDNVSAMVFYLPEQKLTYNYVSWGRTYDNWSLYAFAFWNPSTPLAFSQSQAKNLFSGKGVQIMVNYNF
ncbi:MAG TPA: hypothetical protein VK152_04965 [Paludibacter sp.]|nr:hypothetical protein [Paludibacter sp.]